MIDHIDQVWERLTTDGESSAEFVRLRLPAVRACPTYAAKSVSTGRLALVIEVDTAAIPADLIYPSGLGFELMATPVSTGRAGITRLVLSESNETSGSIFVAVAENLIDQLVVAKDHSDAVTRIVQRLAHWQNFMRKRGTDGLSRNEKIGLYGELIVLRDYLMDKGPIEQVTGAWKGFIRANHDFQLISGNLEVKSTTSNTPHSFHISNVAQLDSVQAIPLHLVFVEAEVSANGHEMLPDIIKSIRAKLDPTSLVRFDDGLIEYGYLDAHAERYEDFKFTFRKMTFYRVVDGFPMIRRDSLPGGIENVRYEVSISACAGFEVDADSVTTELFGEVLG